jgi:glutamate dehydrogenase/leucine dehydrogenase
VIYKGGLRAYPFRTIQVQRYTTAELGAEMFAKMNEIDEVIDNAPPGSPLADPNLPIDREAVFFGGKGTRRGTPRTPEYDGVATVEAFAVQMCRKGWARHDLDVPAGDGGTNGFLDIYPQTVREFDPSYRYYRGTITGKIEDGTDVRPDATALSIFGTGLAICEKAGIERPRIALMGSGNVNGRLGRVYTETKRGIVNVASDSDGTLQCTHPDGMQVTAGIVRDILDNPHFIGGKMEALGKALIADGLDPAYLEFFKGDTEKILHIETDLFVPAVPFPDVINADNIKYLLRNVKLGILEGGNGQLTADAHAAAVAAGLYVAPDIATNHGGPLGSRFEMHYNHLLADAIARGATDVEILAIRERYAYSRLRPCIVDLGYQTMQQVFRTQEEHGTKDPRTAATIIAVKGINNRLQIVPSTARYKKRPRLV